MVLAFVIVRVVHVVIEAVAAIIGTVAEARIARLRIFLGWKATLAEVQRFA
jgi:hypothetical protein